MRGAPYTQEWIEAAIACNAEEQLKKELPPDLLDDPAQGILIEAAKREILLRWRASVAKRDAALIRRAAFRHKRVSDVELGVCQRLRQFWRVFGIFGGRNV